MEELVTVLQHAQSADGAVRSQAEARLQQFAAQSYAGYLVALAGVLASGAQQPETRQLAGVVLKNSVQSTGEAKNVRPAARACLFSQAALIGSDWSAACAGGARAEMAGHGRADSCADQAAVAVHAACRGAAAVATTCACLLHAAFGAS